MKNLKYIAVALFLCVSSFQSMAQTALSSYFLDGTLYNNRLNPAMKAERNYLSFILGNTSVRTKGNVGISNFLYPVGDNKLATFMSGSVSNKEFLGKFPEYARIGMNLDETIFATGFRMLGGFTSVGVSLHSSVAMALPKGFFEFAKKGLQENTYSFSGLNINTMNYMAATVGYSHEVYKGIRVGANLKYLMGLAHANVLVDKFNVELSENRWLIESHAQMQMAMFCEARATLDDKNVINGIEIGTLSPSSSGFAVDLGVVYDMDSIVPGLKFSASVVDLGFIKWKHMMKGQSTDTKVEFNGFNNVDYKDMESSVNDEFERLGNDAAKMVDFTYEGTFEEKTRLNTTMYLGAEYNMPFYKPLSVGVLYGHCFSPFESNKWYEVRGFLNIAPLRWLEASVNYGYGTYGANLGWMLNIHPAAINFFIGSDFMITKVTPQFLPVDNLNAHVVFGFNIAFGKRR